MIDWYSPDEDSYTLADCIKDENIKCSVILDLGTSTGYIRRYSDKSNIVISTDLNMKALLRQKEILPEDANLIHMDLLSCIRQDLIDFIIFNPPYVLYSDDPIIGGGLDGRSVIDRFVKEVEIKTFYLLVIEANKYLEIIENIKERGYNVEIKKIRRVLRETIIILKGSKDKNEGKLSL
jgi:release factor glutamine methyltransferase